MTKKLSPSSVLFCCDNNSIRSPIAFLWQPVSQMNSNDLVTTRNLLQKKLEGENDNLIVQKLQTNPSAFGVFGYSFLEQNSDTMQGSIVGGVEPEFEEIASGNYPIARSLFFYVKKEHIGVIPGITEYMKEFTREDTWGEDGYLVDKGLIPLDEDAREDWGKKINGLVPLEM